MGTQSIPGWPPGMENEKTGSESDKADEEDLGDNVELF